jgi:hypothetical protein
LGEKEGVPVSLVALSSKTDSNVKAPPATACTWGQCRGQDAPCKRLGKHNTVACEDKKASGECALGFSDCSAIPVFQGADLVTEPPTFGE